MKEKEIEVDKNLPINSDNGQQKKKKEQQTLTYYTYTTIRDLI